VKVTRLPVDSAGRISSETIRSAITDRTILVSVMAANNEIGTVAPVEEIGRVCREHNVLFHTDAAQAFGKIAIDVRSMNIDLMSFTAHKVYGPKGVGALYIRKTSPRIALVPAIDGGGHEQGVRSGTLNVPGIVGFGEAAARAGQEMETERERIANLRDKLVDGILSAVEDAELNGDREDRLPGNANIRFNGLSADKILLTVKDVALSTGSACSSAIPKASHVLRAIGLTEDEAKSSIRFGLGRFTTSEEIEYTIGRIADVVKSMRTISPTHHHALT
jgi:cysteine desulfurase